MSLFIFSDASVSNQVGISVGAFLVVKDLELEQLAFKTDLFLKEFISSAIKYVQFETHKSTLAEIKTFLHVMESLHVSLNEEIFFYTDCQSLVDLFGVRRQKLIDSDFKKKDGTPLPHEKIYRELIKIFHDYTIKVLKIKGHNPKHRKNTVRDKIFSVVDKLSRKKLRELVS